MVRCDNGSVRISGAMSDLRSSSILTLENGMRIRAGAIDAYFCSHESLGVLEIVISGVIFKVGTGGHNHRSDLTNNLDKILNEIAHNEVYQAV